MAECACVLPWDSSYDNQVSALDAMPPVHVLDLMYTDDVVAPAFSVSHAVKDLQGYEAFTTQFGSRFNVGPSKTANMGPMGERCTNLGGEDVLHMGEQIEGVDSCVYLGVILDVLLTFVLHTKSLIAKR